MPDLTTEHITLHTVRFTATELESLREAARLALDTVDGTCVYAKDWQALVRLGKGPTRSDRTPADRDADTIRSVLRDDTLNGPRNARA
ncbi:hypothetical protein [Streptomyces niveus]|uniref:hypothetical protein n=1 Tax=Streptomyces niveus TaxID=193462 RepID=UPI0036C9F971